MSTQQKAQVLWTAYESAGFKGEWGVQTDDPAMVAAGDEIIVYPSLSERHARLISAAPDMLAALKAQLAYEAAPTGTGRLSWMELVKVRDAALAKAEGRS